MGKDGNGWVLGWVSTGLAGLGSRIIFHPWFSGSAPETNGVRFRVWFFTRGYSMNNRLE